MRHVAQQRAQSYNPNLKIVKTAFRLEHEGNMKKYFLASQKGNLFAKNVYETYGWDSLMAMII